MAKKLFVGNLSYSLNDDSLKALFEEFGAVSTSNVIVERDTNRSKGFGFVEFEDDDAADAAIKAMSGKEVDGRALTVNEARPREER